MQKTYLSINKNYHLIIIKGFWPNKHFHMLKFGFTFIKEIITETYEKHPCVPGNFV